MCHVLEVSRLEILETLRLDHIDGTVQGAFQTVTQDPIYPDKGLDWGATHLHWILIFVIGK